MLDFGDPYETVVYGPNHFHPAKSQCGYLREAQEIYQNAAYEAFLEHAARSLVIPTTYISQEEVLSKYAGLPSSPTHEEMNREAVKKHPLPDAFPTS